MPAPKKSGEVLGFAIGAMLIYVALRAADISPGVLAIAVGGICGLLIGRRIS
jgi:hypothetical protein